MNSEKKRRMASCKNKVAQIIFSILLSFLFSEFNVSVDGCFDPGLKTVTRANQMIFINFELGPGNGGLERIYGVIVTDLSPNSAL